MNSNEANKDGHDSERVQVMNEVNSLKRFNIHFFLDS